MAMYKLPTDTAASVEAIGILAQDQRVVPHVIMTKAKLRNLGFRISATAADAGKTKVLIGFLPAGRNRVMFSMSMICGNVALAGALYAEPYMTTAPASVTVPNHAITEDFSGTIGVPEAMTELNKAEGSTVAGDKELHRPGWGFKYESLEDIPVILELGTALAAGNEIWGNIVYGQE